MFAFARHSEYQQRHAAPSALQPFPLTQAGTDLCRDRALEFAAWVRQNGLRVQSVISSTSLRAYQTAVIYAEKLGVDIIQTPELCERSVGCLANLTVDEISQVIAQDPRHTELPNDWKSNSDYCLPVDGAESMRQAGHRVARCIQRIRSQKGFCLFVGHGASFRHAAVELGLLEPQQVSRLSMYHAQALAFDHVATEPVYGHWKVRQLTENPD